MSLREESPVVPTSPPSTPHLSAEPNASDASFNANISELLSNASTSAASQHRHASEKGDAADPSPFSYARWSHSAASCRPPSDAAPTGTTMYTLISGGRRRRYLLHVPALHSSRPNIATPLVLEFPGSDDSAERQANRSKLSATADRYGFVHATLEGTGNLLNVQLDARGAAAGPDDVSYVRDVIESIDSKLCIDHSRIYATGFSRGARMSARLASELPGVFAAIGPVSGVRYPRPNNASRAIAVLAVHGLADTINPYRGGGPSYWRTGVPDAIGRWVAHNRCDPSPTQTTLSPHVTRVSYGGCTDGADVALLLISNGGHRWPSGCLSLGRALDKLLGARGASLAWAFRLSSARCAARVPAAGEPGRLRSIGPALWAPEPGARPLMQLASVAAAAVP